MSHGITTQDTAWFYNKPAWHGLGQVVTRRPKDTRAWFKQAGIAWGVEKDELVTIGALERLMRERKSLTGKQLLALAREFALPDHRSVDRTDTHDTLGVVSDEYTEFTNLEVADILDGILGSTVPETAFSLWGGKQVGALTRIPDHIEIGGDAIRQFIYARWRHDGTGALWLLPTDVRVVCANTDRAAVNTAGIVHKITHRGDKSIALETARQALQLSIDYGKQFKKLGDRLARQKVSERELARVMRELYPTEGDDVTKRTAVARKATQEAVRSLFLTGDTQGNSPGTKWCLYNALIEHNQHHRSVRSNDPTVAVERRFIRAVEDPEKFGKLALAAVMN